MNPRQSIFDDLHLDELGRRSSAKWSKYPPDVLPAWVAEMDFPLADPIRQRLHRAIDRDDLGYPPPAESSGLGEVVAEWAERRFGWQVDPSYVMAVPDVVKGIQIVLHALSEPGDGVVIQPPVYPPFFSLVPHAGRTVVENPLLRSAGRYEIDLEDLDRCLNHARVLLLCNPQNPTGRAFSREELEAVAELAERHDALVISDEIHAPLVLPGAEHVAFATLGEEVARRTVTVTAASKAWNFGGLKCGLVVAGSPNQAKELQSLPHVAVSGASILGIEATKAALAEGQPWMDEVVGYLDGNRHLLRELLEDRGLSIGYEPPESTYLGWLNCRPLGLDDPFRFFLDRARVAFSNGRDFGSQGAGFVRFNFGTARSILEEMVQRMARAIAEAEATM